MKKLKSKKLLGIVLTVVLTVCALPVASFATSAAKPTPSPSPAVTPAPTPKPKIPIQLGSEYSKVYDSKEIGHSDVLALLSSKSGTGVTKFSYTWADSNGEKMENAPINAGSYKLTIKVSDKDPIYTGSTIITYIIDKRPLEWDLSGLCADKYSDGTADAPVVDGDLKVSGLIDGDDAKLSYDSITAPDFPSAEVGRTNLKLTIEGAKLEGDDAENYTLPSPNPEISAAITKAYINEITFEGNSNKYRTVVEETVHSNTNLLGTLFHSVDDIKNSLVNFAAQTLVGKEDVKYTFYTAKMQIWKDGEWIDVTEETNPLDGAPVTLPYPEGTKDNSHEFYIYRMKSFDEDAGAIEVWAHTEKVDGLEITLSQGEPILVAYTPKPFNTGLLLALGGGVAAVIALIIFLKLLKKDREEAELDKLDSGNNN